MTVDFDARYSVAGMPGVAWYLRGYVIEQREIITEDGEDVFYDYEPYSNVSMVRAVMVGDDREHEIDVDDLTKLEDEDYCDCCGQIGCPWGNA